MVSIFFSKWGVLPRLLHHDDAHGLLLKIQDWYSFTTQASPRIDKKINQMVCSVWLSVSNYDVINEKLVTEFFCGACHIFFLCDFILYFFKLFLTCCTGFNNYLVTCGSSILCFEEARHERLPMQL
jgi:hypothetical protein